MPILYLGPGNIVKVRQDESDNLKKDTNENAKEIPAKTKQSNQKNPGDSNNNSSLKEADKSKGTYILKQYLIISIQQHTVLLPL